MICAVVPDIRVEGGVSGRCARCAAVLRRYRDDQHHAGEERRRTVGIGEQPEDDGEARAEGEESALGQEQQAQSRPAGLLQAAAGEPGGDDRVPQA